MFHSLIKCTVAVPVSSEMIHMLVGGGGIMLTGVIIAPEIIVLKFNSYIFNVLVTDDQSGDVFVECEYIASRLS